MKFKYVVLVEGKNLECVSFSRPVAETDWDSSKGGYALPSQEHGNQEVLFTEYVRVVDFSPESEQ